MTAFDTERLIAEIECRPSLWDVTRAEYADRELKKQCWDEIIDIFKEDEEDLTVQERKEIGDAVQKKWKSIRGCYTRELNRKRALKAGSDFGSRKSEYMYYKKLKFLKNVVTTKDTYTSSQSEENDYTEYPYADNAPKRMKREEGHAIIDNDSEHSYVESKSKETMMERATVSMERDKFEVNKCPEVRNIPNVMDDEDRLFLLSLLSTLKKVPEHKKMTTKIKIMTLLNDATQAAHDHAYVKEEITSQNFV